jgi:hypothetical protein
MKTEDSGRILARIVARELTIEELEAAAGGRPEAPPFKDPNMPGMNNSSSVTTCPAPFKDSPPDGGADD